MTDKRRSAKYAPDLTHVILTLVGITGLVLFILACRPSWSPDGRKILYSYWDDGAQKAAVAVFDRKTRTSKVIFESSHSEDTSKGVLATQWVKDGQHTLVVLHGGGDALTVAVLPQNAKKAVQTYVVERVGQSEASGFLPLPQVGNQLFMSGEKVRARINLETGEIFSHEEKEKSECLLYEAGDKVLYLKEIDAKKKEQTKEGEVKKDAGEQKTDEDTAEAYEFGELDQKDLSLHPTLTLKVDELTAKGIGSPSGFLDVNPQSSRIATIEDPLKDKQPRILIIGQSGIEQILEPGIKEESFKLGNPRWSRDGKSIYVPALIDDDKAKTAQFVVVELAVDGKSSQIDRIVEGPQNEFGSDYLSATQIALSPDGKFIAASNGYGDSVKPENVGLFLLDVSKADRPVSFYPAPALPKLPKKE